ncbi:MAG: uncharacterized protein JWM27_1843 [Gemmatimonadetes bacterium]|nr:uncharacterized protein [Gemmatimonadota bacterium]
MTQHPAAHPRPQLDPERIVETLRTLRSRIHERFPGSGLARLAGELLVVADDSVARLAAIARPNLPIRAGVWLLLASIVALLARIAGSVQLHVMATDLGALLQVLDAAKNVVLFLGAAVFFLVTLEGRIKRRRALRSVRELRAVAHLVDMHQLTKDPDRLAERVVGTASSPSLAMTPYQLSRYLDYCAELLSLTSKIAALYAQTFNDPVVLGAVDEVEALTIGLSGKVWQKIVVLNHTSP